MSLKPYCVSVAERERVITIVCVVYAFWYSYRDHAVEERNRDPARLKVEREPYTGPVIQL